MIAIGIVCSTMVCVLPQVLVNHGRESTIRTRIEVPVEFRLEPKWRSKDDCGQMALYGIVRLDGGNVSLETIKEVLPGEQNRGCSLLDIERASMAIGHPLEMRLVNPIKFVELPKPFILHTSSSTKAGIGHFIVVVDYDQKTNNYVVLDTAYESTRIQTADSLLKEATGYVLIKRDSSPPYSRIFLLVSSLSVGLLFAVAFLSHIISRSKNRRLKSLPTPRSTGLEKEVSNSPETFPGLIVRRE